MLGFFFIIIIFFYNNICKDYPTFRKRIINSFNSKIYRNIENVYTYRLYQIQILPNVSLGQGIDFTRQEKSGHRGKTKQSSTCSKKIATKVSIHKTGEKKVKITTVFC